MSSRNETLIKAVLDETNMENYTPLSRNEQFLKDIITKKDQCTLKPISRIEEMYFNLHQKIKENSGGDLLKELLDETKTAVCLFSGRAYLSYGTYTIWSDNLTYEILQKILSYNTTSSVTNMQGMFYYCRQLTTIPLIDTSLVINMNSMFENCSKLTTIPQLDTSKVQFIGSMFYGCSKLTTIPQLDTSEATVMNAMFRECSSLITIPQLNTSKITNMTYMFENCSKLTTIDITHMNITSTSNSNYFAYNCYSLTKLIIRNMTTIPTINTNSFTNCYHFTGTTNETYNPQGLKDGRIYVPDDKVEELKTATNWSVYADIIVPLSTLVE